MLIIGDISKVAADFSGVGIGLEGEGLPGFDEGAGVGVEPKFMEEDEAEETEGGGEVEVSSEVLGKEPLVDGREDVLRGSVADHLLEFAIIWDIHN
jgi:hypothetical protein